MVKLDNMYKTRYMINYNFKDITVNKKYKQ